MALDYIQNGQAFGSVASSLLASNMDVNVLRPFVGVDGRPYVNQVITANGKPEVKAVLAMNAPATLRRDDWIHIDEAMIRAGMQRLKAVALLQAAGLTMNIPNGFGKTVLEYETMSNVGPATISMDGIRRSERDRPVYGIGGLPLPIIHKDFGFSARQIATSRNSNTPLDTSMGEMSARKVGEEVEKLVLGINTSFAYGGYTAYGLINFPNRNTQTLSDPSAPGWSPSDTIADILAMKAKSVADYMYGPWMLLAGTAWDQYLDDDYSSAKGDNTLRQRIRAIENIDEIQTVDYLTGFQMVLVQKTTETVRIVIGMGLTTVQWQLMGGMDVEFKVMTIMMPQVRDDGTGNCGIVHGNV